MKKRIALLAVILALCFAATPAYAWMLGEKDITEDYTTADGTLSYDAQTRTLTLNGYAGTSEIKDIFAEEHIERIVLIGENTISQVDSYPLYLMYTQLLEITGTGSLTVKTTGMPLRIQGGNLIIDGVKVNLVSENGKTSIGCASWVELHGGAQLCLDTTNTLTGAVYFEAADGAPYIRVCQGSRLELIAGANSQVASPFAGRLIVEDTSSARIVSYDSCVPESYDGITDSLTLVPIPLENSSYSDQWKVKEGAKSGKYAFTLSQTITEVPNRLSKCEVLIQGSQCENDGVAGLPATGDHARIGLWLTLMVMSGAGMILVRRRVHS